MLRQLFELYSVGTFNQNLLFHLSSSPLWLKASFHVFIEANDFLHSRLFVTEPLTSSKPSIPCLFLLVSIIVKLEWLVNMLIFSTRLKDVSTYTHCLRTHYLAPTNAQKLKHTLQKRKQPDKYLKFSFCNYSIDHVSNLQWNNKTTWETGMFC